MDSWESRHARVLAVYLDFNQIFILTVLSEQRTQALSKQGVTAL